MEMAAHHFENYKEEPVISVKSMSLSNYSGSLENTVIQVPCSIYHKKLASFLYANSVDQGQAASCETFDLGLHQLFANIMKNILSLNKYMQNL